MTKRYLILDTEDTRDFTESLIGTICVKVAEEVNNITGTVYWKMHTQDGPLLFLESELCEV